MTTPNAERVVTSQALSDLAARALEGYGLSAENARKAARVLVLAELFGLRTHGVARIDSYGERIDLGGVASQTDIRVEATAPSIRRVDGANAIGPLVGMVALEAAMDAARDTGVGVAFARASNHFGPCSPYNWLAAQESFASIVASNASTTIAPWGGREARLGNNPIGFGVPRPGDDPVILDMAMSVAARAKIRAAAARGEAIPQSWATDREGRPTSDPRAALDGFLQPMGGHKGYGLALIVDLFAGLLSGASYLTHVRSWQDAPEAPQDLGHIFILIDATRLGSSGWLASRMADFAAILHETPPTDPSRPVMLPGEREISAYHRHRREGVRLDAGLLDRLEARAARAG